MKLQCAVTEKEGIKFAVAQVDGDTMHVPGRAIDTIEALKTIFPKMNIVLMTRNKQGAPIFYGRPDIVNGLGDAVLEGAQWEEYSID